MDQTNCRLPFTLHCVQILRFLYSRLFYKIQTVHFSGALKKVAYMPRSGSKYPRERTAQYWLLSVFLQEARTYVLQARAPESQPLSSVCVTLFHLKQVTNLGVSNIKRCLAYFQSFIERWLPHRRSILRGVHVRKVTTSWVQF